MKTKRSGRSRREMGRRYRSEKQEMLFSLEQVVEGPLYTCMVGYPTLIEGGEEWE